MCAKAAERPHSNSQPCLLAAWGREPRPGRDARARDASTRDATRHAVRAPRPAQPHAATRHAPYPERGGLDLGGVQRAVRLVARALGEPLALDGRLARALLGREGGLVHRDLGLCRVRGARRAVAVWRR
jgi:hypothetical protein